MTKWTCFRMLFCKVELVSNWQARPGWRHHQIEQKRVCSLVEFGWLKILLVHPANKLYIGQHIHQLKRVRDHLKSKNNDLATMSQSVITIMPRSSNKQTWYEDHLPSRLDSESESLLQSCCQAKSEHWNHQTKTNLTSPKEMQQKVLKFMILLQRVTQKASLPKIKMTLS